MNTDNSIPVTAVFDIGKTNKKFLLFDEGFNVVHKQYETMEQAVDDDGYPCEDLDFLEEWIKRQLKIIIQKEDFNITALNFSTYGASLVHLDDEGKRVTPFYNYLKPYPGELLRQFYEIYGGEEQFARETASPPMGMLNSGLQLYWLKHIKPELYKRIRHTLHFPQYLSSIFTGKFAAEYTSIGCHTGMWNYNENRYHRWLDQENMLRLFPAIQPVTDCKYAQFEGGHFKVGPGIHDSSAALIPYLFAMDGPFMLLSTGTWSIALNLFNNALLTFEELKRDCLCYMNMNGDQVKAARLFLGSEYAHQKKKLDTFFERTASDREAELDRSLLEKIIEKDDPARKLQLETANSSGPFPGDEAGRWKIDLFSSYEEAYHQLMMDLAAIQAASIKLAEGYKPVKKIIVTGGFSHNRFFLKLLASRFPKKEIYTASLSHVSALGAALAVSDNGNGGKLQKLLELKRHFPLKNIDIKQYQWKQPVSDE